MPTLTLRDVSKTYPGAIVALQSVTVDVPSATTLVLAGPSGSGKTTLLRLIAGLEPLNSGAICLDGSAIHSLPPHRRGVGFLPERPVLYPHLSVRQNLAFGLPRPPPPELRARVDELPSLLGIHDLLDRMPGELSGGQQQRVALGRVLARRPRILLLDEPFSCLDGPLRQELCRQLHLLQRHLAATMIVVTHEQDEAAGLADRVAVLDAGRLVQQGTPREVQEHPATAFVAWLLKRA
jgi:ABC-type sugar transport system ATPase subunit